MASNSMHVVIGGGTGLIGNALLKQLQSKGAKVSLISRTADMGNTLKNKYKVENVVSWEQLKSNPLLLPSCDGIVNLSGANIMESRWTNERKKEIIESRVGTNRILVNAINEIAKVRTPPKVFVTQSGVGYYPQTDEENPPAIDESYSGPHDNSFPGDLSAQWEGVLNTIPSSVPIRKIATRCGVVLAPKGGALQQMITPFKFGAGTTFGSGKQYFPWIHIDDSVGLFIHVLENNISGPVNMVAPQAVTNTEFTKAFAKSLNRPAFLNTPKFAVEFMFQDRARMLLKGVKVVPKKAIETGYKFKFETLESALKDLF